ncbi:hypothetical protein [Stenotrophomonas maltophilia]|uniref:hypothetical protein n=1 Tax=Stenotrophomonas maltophilia TaxID=40324 RepID=UPI001E61248F|nr:hypothetical protein [Stenotrophomonas maltophilia]
MSCKTLYITLRRLMGTRDVTALRSQLWVHGPVLFARSLALGSPRVVAASFRCCRSASASASCAICPTPSATR